MFKVIWLYNGRPEKVCATEEDVYAELRQSPGHYTVVNAEDGTPAEQFIPF